MYTNQFLPSVKAVSKRATVSKRVACSQQVKLLVLPITKCKIDVCKILVVKICRVRFLEIDF